MKNQRLKKISKARTLSHLTIYWRTRQQSLSSRCSSRSPDMSWLSCRWTKVLSRWSSSRKSWTNSYTSVTSFTLWWKKRWAQVRQTPCTKASLSTPTRCKRTGLIAAAWSQCPPTPHLSSNTRCRQKSNFCHQTNRLPSPVGMWKTYTLKSKGLAIGVTTCMQRTCWVKCRAN